MRPRRADELITYVRALLKEYSAGEWTDAMILEVMNAAMEDVWDRQIALDEDFVIEEHSITTVAGTREYDLPTGYLKLEGVFILDSNTYLPMSKTRKEDMWRDESIGSQAALSINTSMYYIKGEKIGFVPMPADAASIRILYVPTFSPVHTDAIEAYDESGGTITLASGASDEDDAYNGCDLVIYSTSGVLGHGLITDYNGITKKATVSLSVWPASVNYAYSTRPRHKRQVDKLLVIRTCEYCCVKSDNAAVQYFNGMYGAHLKSITLALLQRDRGATDEIEYSDPYDG